MTKGKGRELEEEEGEGVDKLFEELLKGSVAVVVIAISREYDLANSNSKLELISIVYRKDGIDYLK